MLGITVASAADSMVYEPDVCDVAVEGALHLHGNLLTFGRLEQSEITLV